MSSAGGQFRTDVKGELQGKIFPQMVVRQLAQAAGESLEAPSLEVLKAKLDGTWAARSGGW